ncbi:MAG: hypothetical protein PHU46_02055 [Rhodocyclaceae bacterium]|nr:hypothetical protein [Rhodocyclaceae bacterium]
MAKSDKNVGATSGNGSKSFISFSNWKSELLPDLAKADDYSVLRISTEQLAKTLANDTFDRVRSKVAV